MRLKNLFLLFAIAVLATVTLTIIYTPEAFASNTCSLDNYPLSVDSDDNFRRALDWANQYWSKLIRFLVHLVCTGLRAINIPCGG